MNTLERMDKNLESVYKMMRKIYKMKCECGHSYTIHSRAIDKTDKARCEGIERVENGVYQYCKCKEFNPSKKELSKVFRARKD